MGAKQDLESIEGVEIRRLVQCVDGTVLGTIRLRRPLPATYARFRQQGWTLARSVEEAPEIAHVLDVDRVPSDVLLVQRDSGRDVVDSVR